MTAVKKKKKTKQEKLEEHTSLLNASNNDEIIDANEALKLVRKIAGKSISRKTLLLWVSTNKLGRKLGGRWLVYRNVFTAFLNGDK